MAFLDNSGDIILDAVLTDTGRMRLARGDGTFRITKFALGDDEINYELYNQNHPSGSAYYDLDILQTPVLEAFTNNASTMQSKILSIPRTNLLYLPMLKLFESGDSSRNSTTAATVASATALPGNISRFIIAVDEKTARKTDYSSTATENGIMDSNGASNGVIDGFGQSEQSAYIRVDQGLNTDEISPEFSLSQDLVETQYIIQIDNRLGRIVTAGPQNQLGISGKLAGTAGQIAPVSFIDDDNIATYYVSLSSEAQYVVDLRSWTDANSTGIQGPRGTSLVFSIDAQLQLQQSNFLFTKLGSTGVTLEDAGSTLSSFTANYIDSTVRVIGATTGYRLDIPLRFVKKTN